MDRPPDSPADIDTLIASLRTAGAHRFDPVRWHYLEALTKRADTHRGSVKQLLHGRLRQALAEFSARFTHAQCEARESVARSAQQYPDAAPGLQQLLDAGDFNGVRRRLADLDGNASRASLNALVRQLEQHPFESTPAHVKQHAAGSRPELKTLRNFRSTWSKLSVDKHVARALEQAPKNAGPINSHMLVLRSLALMREISPDYLNRFMCYTETLLSLDLTEKEKTTPSRKAQAGKAAKK